MIEVALALAIGVAVTLLIWALRAPLETRWRNDVAWVEHARWRFSPEPYDGRPVVTAAYVVAIVLLIVLVTVLPIKPLAVVIWVLLVFVPKVMVDRSWAKRREQIDEQLPAAVLQMSSSVASGMSLAQAIERLGERAPAPINTEFRVMSNYWRMGADFGATIEEAKRRLRLPNFNLFASTILVNLRMGGNVTETLDRLARSLESIERMRREVHAQTSEGRTNIKVLVIAPFLMLGFGLLMDAQAVGMMFTRPVGHVILSLAVLLTGAGVLWAWRIVNADV